ncbi:MAG: sugar ABC transporter permease [Defluviitaleaceae bacterium]|nr:sugar ABC transporter permease [Defluviitaleaceae bacterium]
MATVKNMPSESPAADAAGLRKRPRKRRSKIPIAPFVLLIPWFIGLAAFRVYPILRSFYLSLTHFHIMDRYPRFIGLDNYVRMFTTDNLFRDSVAATLRYVLLGTPIVLIVSFFIAYVLNFKLKGVNLFRTAYYIPSILGGNVAVAILWLQMFRNNGLVNAALGMFGVEPIMWLRSETFAPFVLIMLSAWQFGSTMLIFLAALQNVSPSLYEAASIDGAKKHQQLFHITLPVISPVLLFNAINVMLRHFGEFNSAFLITEGGPFNATLFMNVYIYRRSFQGFDFGYGSALTWVLLLGIGAVTLILWLTSKFWVHYSD